MGRIADTFGGNLLGIGQRAIPQWRQGLNWKFKILLYLKLMRFLLIVKDIKFNLVFFIVKIPKS